jgi:hypothetical protein
MIGHVTPRSAMLGHVSSGYVRLGQVRPDLACSARSYQVMPGYVIFVKVKSG